MYKGASYFHKSKETDFLLVFKSKGSYLRPIQHLYTVGQNEPKIEVFAPKSRNTNNFKKKRT
jgi:hypothetical protein